MSPSVLSPLLKAERPSTTVGVIVAIAGVGVATAVIYPLSHVAPVVSLGVIYMLVVVAVSTFWGWALGVATGVGSAAAFNFFHLRPVGFFTLYDSRDWVVLLTFVAVAVATGLVGEAARTRTREADQRRREADASAQLAQLLLGAARLEDALPTAGERLAEALGVSFASIVLGEVEPDRPRVVFPLEREGRRIGALLLPPSISEAERHRVATRVVPSLESILAAARHREELQREVVETAALRRSDEIKTAVLRSVSHDLRTPVTAILTAASALDPEHSSAADVGEVRDVVITAATRLSRLIEKLLDLSLLQAGHMEPRRDWYSIEEVLQEAIEQVTARGELFRLSVGRELPLLQGDPAQLERAFVNVLENAARHSGGKPVLIRARTVGASVRVRVVDEGPGIAAREQERIFLPFYRSPGADASHHGSGLGLAIAKGFIEASGGTIAVESLPPHGSSFVMELPVPLTDSPESAAAQRPQPAAT